MAEFEDNRETDDEDEDDDDYEDEEDEEVGEEHQDMGDIAAIMSYDATGTLLMKLAHCSQTIEETQALIDHIGKVEINIGDGLTLLHQAASHDRPDLVDFLCTNAHTTEPKTVAGETPLDQAAWRGAQDAVVFLIKHGADVDCQTHLGYTPLHRAAFYDYPMLARILVMAGADKSIKDSNGETAYDVAVTHENDPIKATLGPEFDDQGNDITSRNTLYNPKHPNYQPAAREALFAAYSMGDASGGEDESEESGEETEEEWEDCDDDEEDDAEVE